MWNVNYQVPCFIGGFLFVCVCVWICPNFDSYNQL